MYASLTCVCDPHQQGHSLLLQCTGSSNPGVCSDTIRGGNDDLEVLETSAFDGVVRAMFKRRLDTGEKEITVHSWWRHQMDKFSALLALCVGNSLVTGEFPSQRPVTRSFDVFFDLHLNKRLSKQS